MEIEEQIQIATKGMAQVLEEISRRLVGQREISEKLLAAIIAGGHVLLEGLPGLAKTTAIKSLAQTCHLKFSRIQFTPDLLPADVTGTQIYNPSERRFEERLGPVFTNLLLADEINRAPAKVQSALLEAMAENQVTIGEKTHKIEAPFLVLATQNPIDQDGTYALPEAQMDRFLFKIFLTYTTPEDEMDIIARSFDPVNFGSLKPQLNKSDLFFMQSLVPHIFVSDKIRRYIVDIIFATRFPGRYQLRDLEPMIRFGASPRGSLALDRAARVRAMMQGRHFVTPQDVKDTAYDVLRHRIVPSFEAEAEKLSTDQMIKTILDNVNVP